MSKEVKQHKKHIKFARRQVNKIERRIETLQIKRQWRLLPKEKRPRQYSNSYLHRWNLHEEIANSITHGIGILIGIVALILMIVDAAKHHSTIGVVSGTIFGSSLILAYISSTLYHAILYPPVKQVFKIVDHSSIFLLIAGTYTPFCLITLHGSLGWTLFGIVWGIALIGIILKIFLVNRFEMLSTLLYLAMGWIAATVVVQLYHHLPFAGCMLLLAGGLAYTFGVIFFVLERIPFFHTVWHLFVLTGSLLHFFAILLYVMPVTV